MLGWASRAHAFFWLVLASVLAGVVAAALTEAREPAYALNSAWVYRLEIGAVTFVTAYVVALVGWLAYQGRSVQRAELPGGAAVELPDLETAAEGFEEYRQATDARIRRLEDSLEALDDTLDDRTS